MTDVDGNIGTGVVNRSENICGLIFDISAQTRFFESGKGAEVAATFKNTVVKFGNLQEAIDAGIEEYTELTDETAVNYLLNGIPYYHIKHFFDRVGGAGTLYVAFADCSSNWNALIDMQKAANGQIGQFGIWTEQSLWSQLTEDEGPYQLKLVNDINAVAVIMANNYNAPASVILTANSAKIKTSDSTVDTVSLNRIPTVIGKNRYVSVLLSQSRDNNVAVMQRVLVSKTPVGCVGAILGSLAISNVSECVGWVAKHDLAGLIQDIELGFGNVGVSNQALTLTTSYDSLSDSQINDLDNKGYIFLVKYTGLDGHIYFSGDQTCSDGDYRTIARNRAINKSRRLVRRALLPYVNSPIKVDPATGTLSPAQVTIFTNEVQDVLKAMVDASELSSIGIIEIPANQNILKNDSLKLKYSVIPIGTSKTILVEEGMAIKQ